MTKKGKQLTIDITIYRTPGKAIGVQLSFKEKLEQRVKHLVKVDPAILQTCSLKVKITGDGTRVSRSMHVVVIRFSIIGTIERSNSPRGNHVLALVNTDENYDGLVEAMEDICRSIESTSFVDIEGSKIDIEHFFCANWKFLALCVGIDAANATYSCIWCKCPSTTRHDLTKTWSITNPNEGARSIEEIKECAGKTSEEKYNCCRQPILPSIPIHHVVPDVLHLFLRVTDLLTNLLILEL